MAIIPLGQFGKPRESALAGVAEKTGEMRKDRNKYRQALSVALATSKIEQADQDRKFLRDTWQNLSNKTDVERKTFMESDSWKDYYKKVQTVLPEVVNPDTGEPIFFPQEKAPEWAPKTEKQKLEFTRKTKEIEAKVRANQPMDVSDAVQLMKVAQLGKLTGDLSEDEYKKMMNMGRQTLARAGVAGGVGAETNLDQGRDPLDPAGLFQGTGNPFAEGLKE